MSGRKEFIVMGTSTVCGEEIGSKGKVSSRGRGRGREREGEGGRVEGEWKETGRGGIRRREGGELRERR